MRSRYGRMMGLASLRLIRRFEESRGLVWFTEMSIAVLLGKRRSNLIFPGETAVVKTLSQEHDIGYCVVDC